MSQPSEPPASNGRDQLDPALATLLTAQYESLREEIVEFQKIQSQEIALAILALGTLLGVAIQSGNAMITLAYPVLAFALAVAWIADEQGVRLKGAFIADRIEKGLQDRFFTPLGFQEFGWDTFIRARRKQHKRRAPYVAAVIIFVGAEIVAMVTGVLLLAKGAGLSADTFISSLLGDSLIIEDPLFSVLFLADLVLSLATLIWLVRIPEVDLPISDQDQGQTAPATSRRSRSRSPR